MIDADLERVLRVPVRKDPEGDSAKFWTETLRKHAGAPALKPDQAAFLDRIAEADAPRGAFGSIGVGGGKTLVSLLAATIIPAKRPVLMIPPGLSDNTMAEYDHWIRHYHLTLPYILPYSILSRPTGELRLLNIAPDLIICDEVHNLKRMSSARTMRFLRYFHDHPNTRVVAMSGTVTGGSLEDLLHLLRISLRDYAPAPRPENEGRWLSVIDQGSMALPADEDLVAMEPLREWSGEKHWQVAYFKRLSSTPGVLCTDNASVDIPLEVNIHTWEDSDEIQGAIETLSSTWQLPDEEDVFEALEVSRHRRCLAAGFWYKMGEAPSNEWLAARKDWHRHLRQILSHCASRGFDSPYLVEQRLRQDKESGPFASAYFALKAWDEYSHIERPPSTPVWVDNGPMDRFLDWWLAKNKTGLIWYTYDAVADLLESKGVRVFRGGDGTPPDGTLAAVQISSYSEGFNLQFGRSAACVLEPPSSGTAWDQLIARVHRPGQKANKVVVDVFAPFDPQKECVGKALERADSMHNLTTQSHRLLSAKRRWVSKRP